MRSQRIRFEATYPWGSSYCEQLRAALEELGFCTEDDPQNEGSDIDGFLVAVDVQTLAAGKAQMLMEMDNYSDDDAARDEEAGYPAWELDLRDRMVAMGVYAIEQDWKHLEWLGDCSLEKLGVEVHLVTQIDREPIVFDVLRVEPFDKGGVPGPIA